MLAGPQATWMLSESDTDEIRTAVSELAAAFDGGPFASTLIIVPIMTLMIGLSGVIYFKRLLNYDFPTTYYASMPAVCWT